MTKMTAKADAGRARVWSYCENFKRTRGRAPTREELDRPEALGGADRGWVTAHYREWLDAGGGDQAGARLAAIEPVRLFVADNGRVVIPKPMRDAMALGADGLVTAFLDEDGVVMLVTPAAAISKAQRLARLRDQGEGSVVDELIAERRAEAAREDAEL